MDTPPFFICRVIIAQNTGFFQTNTSSKEKKYPFSLQQAEYLFPLI